MPPRLEDRIQELCAKALALRDGDPELAPTLKELAAALKEHIHRIREQVVAFPAPERRPTAGD
ncbi:MAG: hypothetical protein JWO91_2675 [Acidobacteriaceae bacterium]|nr:hypothetical protein [Acidobacteriaceae bacterium]